MLTVDQNQIMLNGQLILKSENEDLDFVLQCYKHLNIHYPKFYKMDRMSKWGIICAEILLKDKSLEGIDAYQRAIVLQNSASSLATDKKFQESIGIIPSPALFVYTLPNIVMGEIAIRHNFKGENTFFVTSTFDQNQLRAYSKLLFESNVAKIILCGYLEVDAHSQVIKMWLSEEVLK